MITVMDGGIIQGKDSAVGEGEFGFDDMEGGLEGTYMGGGCTCSVVGAVVFNKSRKPQHHNDFHGITRMKTMQRTFECVTSVNS